MNAVTIVGGGMAGATLALALSRLGEGRITVTLIEAQRPDAQAHPGFDARSIALAQGTCQQLERIGCWSSLAREATQIKTVQVSDRGHGGMTTLRASDYGLPALGQVVELHDAGQRLFSLLEQAPNVSLRCPAKLVASERDENTVTVTLNDGERITSSLLVAADGSFSAAAASLGVAWDEEDYGQTALIANVTTAEPHLGRAFERFTAEGPLALLPMSKGRMSLVWCIDESRRQDAAGWSDRRFIDELQSAFGWRLGEILSVGERHSYPLRLRTARQAVSHRLALVGNAAQTLHPIAGQGFNLGLRDVISLAETLTEASKQGEDVGGYRTLNRYRLRRESDRKATVGLTNGLVHLFANGYAPLVVARNLGLIAMDSCKLLRLLLAYRTLGWVKR